MDRIVETSRSNSNFGNREKKETKFIVGNLGKVALPTAFCEQQSITT